MFIPASRALNERVRHWFPVREFFMRSRGHVHFITLTTRVQLASAVVVVALLASWFVAMVSIATAHFVGASEQSKTAQQEARATNDARAVARYRRNAAGLMADLRLRQEFIEKAVQVHIGALPGAAAPMATPKVGFILPDRSTLNQIAQIQFAVVERITKLADTRQGAAISKLRRLGLDPAAIQASLDGHEARGGPLMRLMTSTDGSVDPRFARMGASLARMYAMERGLQTVPQVLPASLQYISSGFGYREDPIDGGAAFHSGLDFRGPVGAPIHAAAKGIVSFAGQRSGYGNCIEIDHGNGLLTRYAHMSAFRAQVGEQVSAGETIGAIGSSGRSTGPHLHFEVRINDRAVDPRPFLIAGA